MKQQAKPLAPIFCSLCFSLATTEICWQKQGRAAQNAKLQSLPPMGLSYYILLPVGIMKSIFKNRDSGDRSRNKLEAVLESRGTIFTTRQMLLQFKPNVLLSFVPSCSARVRSGLKRSTCKLTVVACAAKCVLFLTLSKVPR